MEYRDAMDYQVRREFNLLPKRKEVPIMKRKYVSPRIVGSAVVHLC